MIYDRKRKNAVYKQLDLLVSSLEGNGETKLSVCCEFTDTKGSWVFEICLKN